MFALNLKIFSVQGLNFSGMARLCWCPQKVERVDDGCVFSRISWESRVFKCRLVMKFSSFLSPCLHCTRTCCPVLPFSASLSWQFSFQRRLVWILCGCLWLWAASHKGLHHDPLGTAFLKYLEIYLFSAVRHACSSSK